MNEKFFDLKSEKQDRMINAALHLFATNDYKHASTDDIIKEAGISKGLLFHYFGSKQGLYVFLVDYSVRYLLFEYERSIGKEKDYFSYHEKLESAKRTVLGNYPYMYIFINRAMLEQNTEIRGACKEGLKKYYEALEEYKENLEIPKLKEGIEIGKLEQIIQFIVDGLTGEYMEAGKSDADKLYRDIKEYLDLIKKMSTGKN